MGLAVEIAVEVGIEVEVEVGVEVGVAPGAERPACAGWRGDGAPHATSVIARVTARTATDRAASRVGRSVERRGLRIARRYRGRAVAGTVKR